MKRTYITPHIVSDIVYHGNLLAGSVTATAPDMEFDCGCGCSDCEKGNHHPQTYSASGGYCDTWDDLNVPFF